MRGTLEEILTKHEKNLLSVKRLSIGVLATLIVEETPILSGSLQNSWNANIGPPLPKNVTIDSSNPTPARIGDFIATINGITLDGPFSFANGQPYAHRIEYEGWSKKKAPAGMLRTSLAVFSLIVDEQVRSVRAGA